MGQIEELSDDFDTSIDLNRTAPPSASPQNGAPDTPAIPASAFSQSVPFPIRKDGGKSQDAKDKLTPDLPPQMESVTSHTADEVLEMMNRTPLFMTTLDETDGSGGENVELEAIKALAYEGTKAEIAANFKEQGNECVRAKNWKDAREFYDRGIVALRRKPGQGKEGEPAPVAEKSSEEEEKEDKKLLEVLHVNRALCNLELITPKANSPTPPENYRSTNLDCAAALTLNPTNIKALYRSAQACFALSKIPETLDACTHGLALDPTNAALLTLQQKALAQKTALDSKARAKLAEQQQRAKEAATLKLALKARQIATRTTTSNPPSAEDAVPTLRPDPASPTSTLHVPVLVYYPLALQSDLLKSVSEFDTLASHLEYLLPPPWDTSAAHHDYADQAAVTAYAQTTSGGLMKVGKKVPLYKVLGTGKVELVDGFLNVFVVPNARAEEWVGEFRAKAEREGKKGGAKK
ncbi:MAG: hypothetical protein M1819_005338 [Sarea resinae]|nr:MAG: hypothetical protein M1819_005338 [Sarea resinae]